MTNAEKKRIKEVIAKTVKDEVRDYRELRHYIESEARNAMLGVVGLLSMFSVCGAILGFFGKDYIVEVISDKALGKVTAMVVQTETDKMLMTEVAGVISNRVPAIIDERVPEMISNKVAVVESGLIGRLDNQTEELEQKMLSESKSLSGKEQKLEERLGVIHIIMAASLGSRPDYDELCLLNNATNDFWDFVATTIKGIRLEYQEKKVRHEDYDVLLCGPDSVHFTPCDYVDMVHFDFDFNCDGAINSLARTGQREYVATLVYAVQHSKRLKSVYLAIAGIERIVSGASFPALGIEEVNQWWSINSTNESYYCAHEKYREIADKIIAGLHSGAMTNTVFAAKALEDSVRVMERDPGCFPVARSVMLQIIRFPCRDDKSYQEWLNQQRGFYIRTLDSCKTRLRATDEDEWWNFKAYCDLGTMDFITTVTNRLTISPAFEEVMKKSRFFPPEIFTDDRFNWPSRRAKQK